MTMELYDLTADDGRSFSPYCWRSKLALTAKDIEYTTRSVSYADIRSGVVPEPKTVPILRHGEKVISDSFAIAEYLDRETTGGEVLFLSEPGRASARFMEAWANQILGPAILRTLAPQILAILSPSDREYFETTRAKKLGTTFQSLSDNRKLFEVLVVDTLAPLEQTLAHHPFFGGPERRYVDFIVFGSLIWPHVVTDWSCLRDLPLIKSWFDRMANEFDSLVGSSLR